MALFLNCIPLWLGGVTDPSMDTGWYGLAVDSVLWSVFKIWIEFRVGMMISSFVSPRKAVIMIASGTTISPPVSR